MSLWRLFYHVVWATRQRASLIDPERASVLQCSFRDIGHERGAVMHAIGIMPDHVHVAVSIPPRIAVATFVKELKGESSHLVNRTINRPNESFHWQPEYGVLSFGERSLPRIVAYLEHQETHHATNDLMPLFEQFERPRPIACSAQ